MGNESEQAASSISQELIDIELDGIPGNERIVLERLTNTEDVTYTTFSVQRYCPVTGEWRTDYTWVVEGLVQTEIENEFWNLVNTPVAILKIWQGSGSFLDYRVIGSRFSVIHELLARETLFQGNVFIDEYHLVEQSGNQYHTWTQEQGEFVLVPYRIPTIPNAEILEYSINEYGKVLLDKDRLVLPVGAILQFIRTDFNDISERFIYSTEDPNAVRVIPYRSAYQFRKPMNITFTIIPGGYDWDNARDIDVFIR